jgi:hypothetical protein
MGANWRLVAASDGDRKSQLQQKPPGRGDGPRGKKAVSMQSENTRAPGASQARFCAPNPHADATRRSRLKFVWLEQLKREVADEAGRNACKIQKVSHRLVCDLTETFARYPSFTKHGEVWAGQATLAFQLGVDVRQVRRAIAVLLKLKILSIKRPSRGRRRDTNTILALLDERPLFGRPRPLTKGQLRPPILGKRRYSADGDTRWSTSTTAEPKKDSSPVGPSGAAQATQQRAEGDAVDRTQSHNRRNGSGSVSAGVPLGGRTVLPRMAAGPLLCVKNPHLSHHGEIITVFTVYLDQKGRPILSLSFITIIDAAIPKSMGVTRYSGCKINSESSVVVGRATTLQNRLHAIDDFQSNPNWPWAGLTNCNGRIAYDPKCREAPHIWKQRRRSLSSTRC